MVYVKWESSDTPEWTRRDVGFSPVVCETLGWLVEENRRFLVLATTTTDVGIQGRLQIPRSSVIEREDFDHPARMVDPNQR